MIYQRIKEACFLKKLMSNEKYTEREHVDIIFFEKGIAKGISKFQLFLINILP